MYEKIDLQAFYNGLDIMFQKKDVVETQKYLESWLKDAEAKGDKGGIVAVCNELGGIYRVTGQISAAKAVYRRSLALLEEIGLGKTEHYATTLINFGDVFLYAGEVNEALAKFTEGKKILEATGLQGDYRMAALCNNISAVYRQLGRFAEAEEALNTSFNIIKGLPACRGDLGTTYVNLGELQVKQGKLEMAKESFKNAIEIFEKDTGGRDVHCSAAFAGLGGVFFFLKQNAEAKRCYEKALELIERDFGRTPQYEIVQKNLQQVLASM